MLELDLLFQDNMMLQRDKQIPVTGTASAGALVEACLYHSEISPHALICKSTGTAAADGKFEIRLDSQKAGEDYLLQITSEEESIILQNIIFGDIYIAGGQSNMEFFMQYENHWEEAKTQAKENPSRGRIRLFTVPRIAYEGQIRPLEGQGHWFTEDADELEYFSSIGYYFAKDLLASEDVPIGIIGCNWGGTSASTWLPKECMEEAPLNIYLNEYQAACKLLSPEEIEKQSQAGWAFEDSPEGIADFRPLMVGMDFEDQLHKMMSGMMPPMIPMGPYNINRPGGLYDNLVLRIAGFPCSGVLWYQGESDSGPMQAPIYDKLLQAMILQWRKIWNDELPFFIVQLAPFGKWLACVNNDYSTVRACQQKVAETVPNVSMVSILDLGSYYDIHPKEKKEIARRLALQAQSKIYQKNLLCESPAIASIRQLDDTRLAIEFTNGNELTQKGCNNDIRVQINGRQVLVSSFTLSGMQMILTVPNLQTASAGSKVIVDIGTADYGEIHIHNEAGFSIRPGRISINLD